MLSLQSLIVRELTVSIKQKPQIGYDVKVGYYKPTTGQGPVNRAQDWPQTIELLSCICNCYIDP